MQRTLTFFVTRRRRLLITVFGAALIALSCYIGNSSRGEGASLGILLAEKSARDGAKSKQPAPGHEVDMSLLPADAQREALGKKFKPQNNPEETGVVRTYDKMLSNGPFTPPTAKLVREAEAKQEGGLGGKVGNVNILRSAGQVLAAQLAKSAQHKQLSTSNEPAHLDSITQVDTSSDIEREELKRMETSLKAKMKALEEKAGSEELSGGGIA